MKEAFADFVQQFFPSDRIAGVDFSATDSPLELTTRLSAVVTLRGKVPYDGPALLREIDGVVIDANDRTVVIEGRFNGNACLLTITTAV